RSAVRRAILRPGIRDHLLCPFRLLVERPRSKRRLALREEVLVVQVRRPCNRRRDVALQTPQAVARWSYWQASGHEARLMELLSADATLESGVAVPEFVAANRGDTPSYPCVIFNAAHIRESIAPAEQRIFSPSEAAISAETAISSEAAVCDATAEEVVAIRKADEIDLRHSEAPPRREEVTGAARQPADVSEAESHVEPIAPPKERHIGRRPNRVITPASIDAHRARPPRPVTTISE